MVVLRPAVVLGSAALLVLLAGCGGDAPAPTAPRHVSAAVAGSLPSGERLLGQKSIEPAYDYMTGSIVYLGTPLKSPFPTKANSQHATAPLYLIEYPPGSNPGTLNCMGVPGNCPDHDGEVATAATQIMSSVYGNDPTVVPGHDHLVGKASTGGDFNVAWEVHEILFTSLQAAQTHITTLTQLNWALTHGQAIDVDLGFAFTCNIEPATVYWNGTPVP